MAVAENLASQPITFFERFNRDYDNGLFRGSEATKYNMVIMRKWLAIRDNYTYTEDTSGNNWKYIDIKEDHSKYGTNYIFIDPDRKLWRIKTTGAEFYGDKGEPFEF